MFIIKSEGDAEIGNYTKKWAWTDERGNVRTFATRAEAEAAIGDEDTASRATTCWPPANTAAPRLRWCG